MVTAAGLQVSTIFGPTYRPVDADRSLGTWEPTNPLCVDAGFEGSFDLEVMGPRVEEEGYPSAVRRSVEAASDVLDRHGA